MGAAIGVDLGERRIGIAVAPADVSLALAHDTLQRADRRSQDHAAIVEVVARVGAASVVIGLPVSLTGTRGPAAEAVAAEASEIAAALRAAAASHAGSRSSGSAGSSRSAESASGSSGSAVPPDVQVVLWDERFTTVQAERRLRDAGIRGRAARRVIDQASAAVILQSWLDRR